MLKILHVLILNHNLINHINFYISYTIQFINIYIKSVYLISMEDENPVYPL